MRGTVGVVAALLLLATACNETATTSPTEPADSTTLTSVASASEPTVLSGRVDLPEGFTVPAGETWIFDPEADTTVTVSANVIVLGTLVMQPASGDIEHALIFEGVDEGAFVGGGMDPVDSDVGLWVMGDGQLLIEGEEKVAWAYEYDPDWDGDEVVAAPNTPDDYDTFTPVTSTPEPNDLGYQTELLNLTRNVRIEGTPDGYTHVFIRSNRPQTIRYAALRYVAPTFGDSDQTGRYGIHLHMSGDGTRGSIIEGVVIRDAGNHSFVPHASHGITFRDTIAYQVLNEPYWWDPTTDDPSMPSNDTEDVLWDRAVAAGVDFSGAGNEFRMTGFTLGDGENMTITNSVAVGIQGERGFDRSGFSWPEGAQSTWTFENNVAHNNEAHGIFVWQNNSATHLIDGFTAYYNAGAGIEHGAYENAYVYQDLVLLENQKAAIVSLAQGEPGESAETQIWQRIRTDQAVLGISEHALEGETPVRFVDCDFSEVIVDEIEGEARSQYDFVDCGLEPEQFDLEGAHGDSRFRVQRADGSAYELHGDGTVRDIDAFYEG